MEEGWKGGKDPAFYPVPSCPYFTYPVGASSPYGDEILPLLRFLAGEGGKKEGKGGREEGGAFDAEGFAKASFEFLKEYKGRLNHVSKLFVEAREAGKEGVAAAVDDSQAHGLIKVPLMVARYYGCPSLPSSVSPLLQAVESAVRVHQQNDLSVACSLAFAALLHHLIVEGGSVRDAALWAETSVDSPLPPAQREILTEVRLAGEKEEEQEGSEKEEGKATKGKLNREQIKEWGMSCALPGVWKGLLYAAMHAESYRDAVSFNIWAGGDVCSRNIGIGALWGAATAVREEEGKEEGGEGKGIPKEWRDKTDVLEEVEQLVEKMFG